MEHISQVLGRLDRGKLIPDLMNSELELTLEEKREELRKSLCVSSLSNTFESFKPIKGTEKALAAFKALASGKTGWKLLICYGGVGNGKTHLCEATTIELYKQGIGCAVQTMARMMRHLKACFEPENTGVTYDEMIQRWCQRSHLIIDDVGMGGSGSEWEYGQLEEIVVTRYRDRLFTIMTTNRDLTELPERIVSRFRELGIGMIVLNEAPDYRRK